MGHIESRVRRWLVGALSLVAVVAVDAAPASAAAAPNDPYFHVQWNMRQVRALAAWERSTGEGTVIAVLGGGLFGADPASGDFPDFDGRVLPGATFLACQGMPSRTDLQAFRLYGGLPEASLDLTPCGTGDQFDGPPADVPRARGTDAPTNHENQAASQAAAGRDNGVGIVGVAPDAQLLPVKFADADARVLELDRGEEGEVFRYALDFARAVRWAALNGADVISLSWVSATWALEDHAEGLTVLQDAVDFALARGVVVVVSGGNTIAAGASPANPGGVVSGQPPALCEYPAHHAGVVCVTGTDSGERRSLVTAGAGSVKLDQEDGAPARGRGLVVAAPSGTSAGTVTLRSVSCEIANHFGLLTMGVHREPGVEVASCVKDQPPPTAESRNRRGRTVYPFYGPAAGSSFATPHVAGLAALLTAQGCDQRQVHSLLKTTSRHPIGRVIGLDGRPVTGTGTDVYGVWSPAYGWGIIDADRATQEAGKICRPQPTTTAVTCEPAELRPGRTAACTAHVTEDTATPRRAPIGRVHWTSDRDGTFSPSSCELTGTVRTASCRVDFRPDVGGPISVRAAYGGGRRHAAGTGSFRLPVGATGSADARPR